MPSRGLQRKTREEAGCSLEEYQVNKVQIELALINHYVLHCWSEEEKTPQELS